MKYFVTGATGFVGGRLAAQLVARGHQVVCLARQPSKADMLTKLGATLIKGDVNDRNVLREGMRGVDGGLSSGCLAQIGD